MDDQIQQQVFAAMESPQFYPHRVSSVRQTETHASKVFLTGEYVYKIKKSVDLGFLNFSTLENRRHFCCREIILNRRLTKDIYLGVVAITRYKGRLFLDGKGEPVEYAVRMRQIDPSQSLKQMIRIGAVSRMDMVALGNLITSFYRRTPQSELIHKGDGMEAVITACKGNFEATRDSAGVFLDHEMWETVQGAALSFLKRKRAWFQNRFKAGKIRDCHGDLRTGHVYFTNTGIQIMDCIEFNDLFRHIDIISDLAFLLMDLDFIGESELGDILLNEFLKQARDLDAVLVLAFYKCYRAMVKCKVNCLLNKTADIPEEAKHLARSKAVRYLDLASQYALQFFRPSIWVVMGKPATGKSTIAKKLSDILDIPVFRSDIVRKEIFGLSPHENAALIDEKTIYSAQATAITYGKLLGLAQEEIRHGTSVILDATYSREKFRSDLIDLAADRGVGLFFIECDAPEDTIKKRLLKRQSRQSVSDARIDHFKALTARYERFRYTGDAIHIPVETGDPLEAVIRRILVRAFGIRSTPLFDIEPSTKTMNFQDI